MHRSRQRRRALLLTTQRYSLRKVIMQMKQMKQTVGSRPSTARQPTLINPAKRQSPSIKPIHGSRLLCQTALSDERTMERVGTCQLLGRPAKQLRHWPLLCHSGRGRERQAHRRALCHPVDAGQALQARLEIGDRERYLPGWHLRGRGQSHQPEEGKQHCPQVLQLTPCKVGCPEYR